MPSRRPSNPALGYFIDSMWATECTGAVETTPTSRERVLPSGGTHLAFLLPDRALRLFRCADDGAGDTFGSAVVCGVRTTAYIRETSEGVSSVGAMLRPGAAEVLFGVPAAALAGRHTRLDELWGSAANSIVEQLSAAQTPELRLQILEQVLAARLPAVRGLHPAVAHALQRLPYVGVGKVVTETGYSHRRVIAAFREQVGVAPKLYCRLMRFRQVMNRLRASPSAHWSEIALAAGYSDQPHFTRDFREFSGMTPEEYRRCAPQRADHVPLAEVNFLQDTCESKP